MAKQIQLPLPLRILQSIFPSIEKVSPWLANKLTVEFFFRPINFKPTTKENAALEKAETRFLTVGRKKVLTYSWGEGAPILFTHGWAGRGTQFYSFIEPFCQAGFKCVAFDAPAHGRSSGGKTHLGEFYDTLEQLQQIHGPFEGSIGHSFGGQVNFYSRLGSIEIKRMILIGSPSRADNILENYLAKINGSKDRIAYFRQYVKDNHQLEFETLTTTSMANRLEEMPVLIIHDRDDKEVSLGDARALKDLLPFATLIETDGLGHNRILKNEHVIHTCLDFMQGNDVST